MATKTDASYFIPEVVRVCIGRHQGKDLPSMGTISGYYSTVQKILTRITSNTLKEFEELETDEQRIEYVMSLEYVRDSFKVKSYTEGKSIAESKKLRERGNVYFQKKDYREALEFYTKAILLAPMDSDTSDGSEAYVLALGNRSATLFKLRECRRCLEDINVALKYGYPVHLLYKLYDRQARCYQELGYTELALESFKNILGVIADAKLDDHKKDSVLKGVKRQIAAIEGTPIGEDLNVSDTSGSSNSTTELRMVGILGEDDSIVPPPINGPENKVFPGACESFQVKYSSDRGRYGVSTQNINSGDVLVLDNPYAAVLGSTFYENRCFHCFRKLILPIGCHRCVKARYCTEKCRKESWDQYHRKECPILLALLASGTGSIALLTMRIMVRTGLQKILKCKKNPFSDKRDAHQSLFTSKGVYMGGYMGIYNLLTHHEHRSRNDLLQYTMLAVYLLQILDESGFFDDSNSSGIPIRVCIGGILLRLLQIISCNGIEITEMQLGNALQRCNPDSIGLALFPTASLLNHSCDPNLELIFYNTTCVVRAIQNIPSGKELCIDYGYIYYITPKKQRQLSLRAQYFFDCRCNACVRDWTIKSNLKSDIPILKCMKCTNPLLSIFSMNDNPLAEEQDPTQHQCRKCGHVQNPMQVYEKLQKSGLLCERAVEQARMFEMKRALPMIQHQLSLLDQHVCLPWKDYVTCVSTIKQCYRMEGNRDKNPPAHGLFQ